MWRWERAIGRGIEAYHRRRNQREDIGPSTLLEAQKYQDSRRSHSMKGT